MRFVAFRKIHTMTDRLAEIRELKKLTDLYYRTPTPSSEIDTKRLRELESQYLSWDITQFLLSHIDRLTEENERLREFKDYLLKENNDECAFDCKYEGRHPGCSFHSRIQDFNQAPAAKDRS
jgi:hypothetical protein